MKIQAYLPGNPGANAIHAALKYFRRKKRATLTKPIITGTSTSGPMTALRHNPEIHYV
jgi:hypothetical protein